MPHFVYLVTHIDSGRVYVGKTSRSVTRRWDAHRYRGRQGFDGHLYRALRKYGESAFDVQTLAVANTNGEANRLERAWIVVLRSNQEEFGFNHTIGGDGAPHTAETKAKISRIQKDNPRPDLLAKLRASRAAPEVFSANVKAAWAAGKFDNKVRSCHSRNPEETFRKSSESMRKAWAEGRMKGAIGRRHSQATLEQMSISRKGRKHTEATKQKISDTKRRKAAAASS